MDQANYESIMAKIWLKWKGIQAETVVHHHEALQPHRAIPKLARAPFGSQTTRMVCQCASQRAWEKQPVKADEKV